MCLDSVQSVSLCMLTASQLLPALREVNQKLHTFPVEFWGRVCLGMEISEGSLLCSEGLDSSQKGLPDRRPTS